MYYALRLKSNDERIDRINSDSLENANSFFMQRKQMDEKSFDKLFHVTSE